MATVGERAKSTVVFVDDEEMILKALQRQFDKQKQFKGIFLSDPLKVEDILNNYDVDIIVADIEMPRMDGISLLTKIKETHPEVFRIMLTAHGDYDTSLRAVTEAEVFGFITKPWEKSYLFGHLEMARRVISNRKEALEQEKEKIELNIPAIVVAQWDDEEGPRTIEMHPENDLEQINELVKRSVMTASGIFGYGKRFANSIFNLPIHEYNVDMRIYLNYKKRSKGEIIKYGIFIFANSIGKEDNKKLDQLIKKFDKKINVEKSSIAVHMEDKDIYKQIKEIFD